MGRVGAKLRVDSSEMGSISSLGGVTSLKSTTEGSSNVCSSEKVSSYSINMPH